MSPMRFATAEALFETFPELSQKISAKPSEQIPTEFLQTLMAAGKIEDAVTFCSYLLPRREAVWWACGRARALLGEIPQDRIAPLITAEAWVQHPDDQHRTAALEIGTKGNPDDPLTWLALAAGWSSGSLVASSEVKAPVPPYMTARAARIAILLSAAKLRKVEREIRLRSCIAEGIKLAETGLG